MFEKWRETGLEGWIFGESCKTGKNGKVTEMLATKTWPWLIYIERILLVEIVAKEVCKEGTTTKSGQGIVCRRHMEGKRRK